MFEFQLTMKSTHRRVSRYRAIGLQLATCLILASACLTAAPANARDIVMLNGHNLTLDELARIAEGEANIKIAADGMARIKAAHDVIQHYVDGNIPAYGINTMYGEDVDVTLSQSEIKRFNRINVFQEATTVGDDSRSYLKPSAVRAAWACLVNSYAKGFSGASPKLAAEIVRRVNANEIPMRIEDSGSMGDADLNMNNALAISLYKKPGFELGARQSVYRR